MKRQANGIPLIKLVYGISLIHFRNLNSVEESSDGHINIPDLNETAKELDISLSALEDYLNKLNEKGAGFVF